MLTRDIFLIENNQEIKIKPEEIKKGQLIKIITHNGRGVVFSAARVVTLSDSYKDQTVTPFGTMTRGLVVEVRIPPSSEVVTVRL